MALTNEQKMYQWCISVLRGCNMNETDIYALVDYISGESLTLRNEDLRVYIPILQQMETGQKNLGTIAMEVETKMIAKGYLA